MAYEVRKSNGTLLTTVKDGTTDKTSSSIVFIGKRFADYGLVFNENNLHLLENFANNSPPINPIKGQLWFDSTPGIEALKVWINPTVGWRLLNFTADFTQQTVQGAVDFLGVVTFKNDNVSEGQFTFQDRVEFVNTTVVFTDSTIDGNFTFDGKITFSDTITFDSTVVFNGQLQFTGPVAFDEVTTFNNDLVISGVNTLDLTAGGTLALDSNAQITLDNNSSIIIRNNSLTNVQSNSVVTFESTSQAVFQDGSILQLDAHATTPGEIAGSNRLFSQTPEGNDSNTVLLLQFGGVDGATTATDSALGVTTNGGAGPANSIAFAGDAAIDGFISQNGSGSLGLDGTGDYITITDNTNFDFGTTFFTHDTWIYTTVAATAQTIYSKGTSTTDRFELIMNASDQLQFLFDDGVNSIDISGGRIETFKWHHVAVERMDIDGTNHRVNIYIDGDRAATVSIIAANYDFDTITGDLEIGRRAYGTFEYWNGNIDSFRMEAGEAKYQGSFRPRLGDYAYDAEQFVVPAYNNGLAIPINIVSQFPTW